MIRLSVEGLTLRAPGGETLVHELDLQLTCGEVTVLMGPSGSGKSSVLGWLTGTLPPGFQARGQLMLDGRSLLSVPTERRRIGLMLQSDFLFPHMTVAENLLFGLRGGSRGERRERVAASLADAGLAGLGERDPATLSGGQRARVSLLRTLLSDPAVLLLDEPFSRLDAARREQIRAFTWQQARALPVLLVTHDLADIPSGARVIEIGAGGRAVADASCAGLRRTPTPDPG